MALLLDNDVVHKLAQMDLLVDSEEILRSKFGQLSVLHTLKFKFCPHPSKENKRNRAIQKYGSCVVTRIESFIASAENIDTTVSNHALLQAMSEEPHTLDAGEMQLVQTLLDSNGGHLFTGDKKFLASLSKLECIEPLLPTINDSFICFEQIMIVLIQELGFDTVKTKYLKALDSSVALDKTLQFCMEGKEEAQEATVLKNLQYHIEHLRSNSSDLLTKSKIGLTKESADCQLAHEVP